MLWWCDACPWVAEQKISIGQEHMRLKKDYTHTVIRLPLSRAQNTPDIRRGLWSVQHLWRTSSRPSDKASDPRGTAWCRQTAYRGQRWCRIDAPSSGCRRGTSRQRSSRHSHSRDGCSVRTAYGRSRRFWRRWLHPCDSRSPAVPTGSIRPNLQSRADRQSIKCCWRQSSTVQTRGGLALQNVPGG